MRPPGVFSPNCLVSDISWLSTITFVFTYVRTSNTPSERGIRGLKKTLRNIQKWAIRYCHGYERNLKEVGLTTVAERGRLGDILQNYKILSQIDDVENHTWFSKLGEHHQKRKAVYISSDRNITVTDYQVKSDSNTI